MTPAYLTGRHTRRGIFAAAGVAAIAVAVIFVWQRPPGTKVTAEEFGDKWPLTVPVAYVSCSGPSITVVRTPDRKAYALTGVGESAGFPSVLPIRKHDPEFPDLYVSKFALIDVALKLCK